MPAMLETSDLPRPNGHGLLSKKELARFLGVTPRTVEFYQPQGLPFYRLGPRRNRYDLGAVRAWLHGRCRVVQVR